MDNMVKLSTAKIRGLLIDEKTGKVSVKDVDDDFRALQQVIDADFFEIARRKIGDKTYAIVCDDEGLLKDRRITAVNLGYSYDILFGSLFICNELGPELASLLDVDINKITQSIRYNTFDSFPILLIGD